MCVSLNEFGKYGVGLFLYFKFLKWMAILYSVMSVLMIMSLVSNITSNYLTTESRSNFDKATAAN